MRLVLVLVIALATACAKKQTTPAASPPPPAETMKSDAPAPTGAAPDNSTETHGDPCDGGEVTPSK